MIKELDMVNHRIEYNPKPLPDIVYKAYQFQIAVENFISKYDEEMKAPASFDRGVKVSHIMNDLHKALVLWKIEMDFYYSSLLVKQEVDKHNAKFDDKDKHDV